VPKLWDETIDAHRRTVREAILDTTWALVAEHGLLSVTMSQIAEQTGIGRATLYKYFPDVEAILLAWHERQVASHLVMLGELRDQAGDARQRLEAVLEAYALMSYHREHHGTEVAALLHRGEHVDRARRQLLNVVRDLLAEVAESGQLRDDVAPDELASYCLHALTAASSLPSKAAVRRLVTVTLGGLRPPARSALHDDRLPEAGRSSATARSPSVEPTAGLGGPLGLDLFGGEQVGRARRDLAPHHEATDDADRRQQ
jgi:AcrR family transcriptional regulator